jgi:hypothetical protein
LIVEPQVPSDRPYPSTSGNPYRTSNRVSNSAEAGVAPQTLNRSDKVSGRTSSGSAERYDYMLTEKGRDLFGVLRVMNRWGDRWPAGEAGPPVAMRHEVCGPPTRHGRMPSSSPARTAPVAACGLDTSGSVPPRPEYTKSTGRRPAVDDG